MKEQGLFYVPANVLFQVSVYLIIFVVGLQYSYYKIFYSFALFDDEGTMMHLVRIFVDDAASYDLLQALYGPFYFLHKYAIYSALNADVSHDITRCTTIVFWGLIALVGAFFVHRVTRSFLIAAIVQMQLILHLGPLAGSPGHPQEIALLVIVCALLLSSFVGYKRFRLLGFLGLGAALD